MQRVKTAKEIARQCLKGKWHLAICVFCLVAAALGIKMLLVSLLSMLFGQSMSSFVSSVISAAGSLAVTAIELFIFSPLYIGSARWLWQIIAGADEPLDTVFYYYETLADYKKAIEVAFGFLWRLSLYAILCFIPFLFMTGAKQLVSGSVHFGIALKIGVYFGWVFMGVCGIILLITFVASLYLVLPTLFADDSLDSSSVFRLARIMSKGRVAPIMYILLKFLPLIALCLLAVPIIWVAPYLAATVTAYSRDVIDAFKTACLEAQKSA